MALDSHGAADEELVEEQDDEDCSRRRIRAMLLAFEHDEKRWKGWGCGGANDLARGEISRERSRAQVEEPRIMGLLQQRLLVQSVQCCIFAAEK